MTERVGALTGKTPPADDIREVIRALPRTRWLDGSEMDWFTFALCDTRLTGALARIFAVAETVDLPILQKNLAKSLPVLLEVPTDAFRRYLAEAPHCILEGDRVRRVGDLFAASLTPGPEAVLVEILQRCGRQAQPSALRQQAARAGLSSTSVTRMLRFSPLVVRGPGGGIQLIGVPAGLKASQAPKASQVSGPRGTRAGQVDDTTSVTAHPLPRPSGPSLPNRYLDEVAVNMPP